MKLLFLSRGIDFFLASSSMVINALRAYMFFIFALRPAPLAAA